MAIRNLLNRGRAKFAENLRASSYNRDLQNEATLSQISLDSSFKEPFTQNKTASLKTFLGLYNYIDNLKALALSVFQPLSRSLQALSRGFVEP